MVPVVAPVGAFCSGVPAAGSALHRAGPYVPRAAPVHRWISQCRGGARGRPAAAPRRLLGAADEFVAPGRSRLV